MAVQYRSGGLGASALEDMLDLMGFDILEDIVKGIKDKQAYRDGLNP